MGGSREREKESCSFSKYTATNLAAETPRLWETCWQEHCQVCGGAATITICFSDCVIHVEIREILLLDHETTPAC